MQDILAPEEIKRRCRAIDLAPERLARDAGIAPSTMHRLGRHDTRLSKLRKLTAALVAREQRLFRHLFELYRDEARP